MISVSIYFIIVQACFCEDKDIRFTKSRGYCDILWRRTKYAEEREQTKVFLQWLSIPWKCVKESYAVSQKMLTLSQLKEVGGTTWNFTRKWIIGILMPLEVKHLQTFVFSSYLMHLYNKILTRNDWATNLKIAKVWCWHSPDRTYACLVWRQLLFLR